MAKLESSSLPDTLDELTDVKRQLISSTVARLEGQGASPGDAWTTAAVRQKQQDLPEYTPTEGEQQSLERVSQQVESDTPNAEVAASIDAAQNTSDNATSSSSEDSGIDSKQPKSQSQQEDQPQPSASSPSPEFQTPGSSTSDSMRSDEDSADGDDNSDSMMADNDTTEDTAQDILDNARAYLDNAVGHSAQSIASPGRQGARAENDRYTVERDSDNVVVTLRNKETGGYLVGDGEGRISDTKNLTESDQQAWRGYRQEQERQEGRQRQRRKQRQQRRREQSDLSL